MIQYLKNTIKKYAYPFFGRSFLDSSINPYKTFWINILAFGWKGFKFPIYIYKNVKIYNVGTIDITCPLERGLIKIGVASYEFQKKVLFSNGGKIIFDGPVLIKEGVVISNIGFIHFKGYNRIGSEVKIIIRNSLTVGKQFSIGFCSLIMDSNEHFTIDVEKLVCKRNTAPIVIGDYNWIGNTTYIKKGTVTPDYLIVASSNSPLMKDYSDLPAYSVIGGSPAKLIASGIRRIYDTDVENELNDYFLKNQDKNIYRFDLSQDDLDVLCSAKKL